MPYKLSHSAQINFLQNTNKYPYSLYSQWMAVVKKIIDKINNHKTKENRRMIATNEKLIFSPQVAKYLLNRKFQIIDIKPDRNDRNKTLFIFKNDDKLAEAINDYKNTKQ